MKKGVIMHADGIVTNSEEEIESFFKKSVQGTYFFLINYDIES